MPPEEVLCLRQRLLERADFWMFFLAGGFQRP
jgi:hypothetical protein